MIGRLSTPAGSVCSDCGQTICSTCQQCHYCCDIDLPCAATLRRRIAQALVAIDPQNTDNGGTGWVLPQVLENVDKRGHTWTNVPHF